MGATVAACRKENQPKDAPAAPPRGECGNLAEPPDTGYIPPSSACTRARKRIATPPMTQEMTAAGPAVTSPFWAPKSQPEPMREPVEAHNRPIRPISRFRETGRRTGRSSPATVAMTASWRTKRSAAQILRPLERQRPGLPGNSQERRRQGDVRECGRVDACAGAGWRRGRRDRLGDRS